MPLMYKKHLLLYQTKSSLKSKVVPQRASLKKAIQERLWEKLNKKKNQVAVDK